MMKKIQALMLSGALVLLSTSAFALVDYAGVADGIEAEITAAIPAFITLIGLVVGVPLAFKVVKRIAR
ncbi:MAG: hypothetical protein C4560_01320 [Nitrospiraceae bacterium]|nr:MAG: hypothetical protein C4560_01320 [Nitrospiraceae bacterium]